MEGQGLGEVERERRRAKKKNQTTRVRDVLKYKNGKARLRKGLESVERQKRRDKMDDVTVIRERGVLQ